MNIKKILLPIGSFFLITPLFTQSCFPGQIYNTNENIVDDNKGKVKISTAIPDVLDLSVGELEHKIKDVKDKLKETIEYSNLKQWNDFYSGSVNGKQKSIVWKPSPLNISIYKNQDPQFQYFNNFLHTNNNISGTPSIYQADQRSFLFERWYLFYLEAVKGWKDHEIFDKDKISLTKITEAFTDAVLPPFIPDKIIKIFAIITAYLSSPLLNKLITINRDILMRQVEEGAKVPKIWSKYHETSNNISIATGNFITKIIEKIFLDDTNGNAENEAVVNDWIENFKKIISDLFEIIPGAPVIESDFYTK